MRERRDVSSQDRRIPVEQERTLWYLTFDRMSLRDGLVDLHGDLARNKASMQGVEGVCEVRWPQRFPTAGRLLEERRGPIGRVVSESELRARQCPRLTRRI